MCLNTLSFYFLTAFLMRRLSDTYSTETLSDEQVSVNMEVLLDRPLRQGLFCDSSCNVRALLLQVSGKSASGCILSGDLPPKTGCLGQKARQVATQIA